jgi:hypothetical protein
MRLILLHKILVIAAAILGVLVCAWGIHDYASQQRTSSLAAAGVGIVLSVILAVYFRGINKRYAAISGK